MMQKCLKNIGEELMLFQKYNIEDKSLFLKYNKFTWKHRQSFGDGYHLNRFTEAKKPNDLVNDLCDE
jgi:hypothetical protein